MRGHKICHAKALDDHVYTFIYLSIMTTFPLSNVCMFALIDKDHILFNISSPLIRSTFHTIFSHINNNNHISFNVFQLLIIIIIIIITLCGHIRGSCGLLWHTFVSNHTRYK
jgi:heme/copper-type cytochrome/quinol oxidase subunit 4